MKYSEAIRLGSMLYPQGFGRLADITDEGKHAVCANGAAAIGLGIKWEDLEGLAAPLQIRHLAGRRMADCPECGLPSTTLTVVVCLNDEHRWTRERIADWLAASGNDFEIDLSLAPSVRRLSNWWRRNPCT